MVPELSPRDFLARRAAGADMTLVDVREGWETTLAPVPTKVMLIPMAEIPNRLGELDPAAEIVVVCRSGGRSLQVASYLSGRGFAHVSNLAGGILAWSRDLDPTIVQY